MLAGATGVMALSATAGLRQTASAAESMDLYKVTRGNIKQSVGAWCFKPMPIEELADHAVQLGLTSVELTTPDKFPILKERGLICAMTSSHGFTKGFAHVEEHEECLKNLTERIDAVAAAGFPSVITFSGFRRGISDEQGMKNMVDGLKKIAGYAEKKRVNLCLEMLNSRVHIEMRGHPDYFCDNMDLSVEICKRVSSERVKMLFDIYHVQIMHGDIITRIKQYHPWIAHYHTAGVPGRNEIDDTQEIHYPPIMKAILETGYKGFVGQEFVPLHDKVASLSQAIKICDV
jgi:hydroxypyruvate isomerase